MNSSGTIPRWGARLALITVTLALVGILIVLVGWPASGQASTPDPLDVWYGHTPTADGVIAPGEYAGAQVIRFAGYGGEVVVYLRHDTLNLYVAFDLPDTTSFPTPQSGPAVQVFLDTNNDKAAVPQPDDYRLTTRKDGQAFENQGTGSGWSAAGPPVDWIGAASTRPGGWQAEFSVEFDKLGLGPGAAKTIGLALANVWTLSWPVDYYWPPGAYWLNPSTWGEVASAENWSSWYFKAGGWTDYAPNGVPDFDQKQDNWGNGQQWTYCGPVAAANSLWWFDSKYEPAPVPPPTIHDGYPLIQSPVFVDDHDPANAVSLVENLAGYFHTSPLTGTLITNMHTGLQHYLYDHGLYDDYLVTLAVRPSLEWVAEELLHSEDVILLLGFWELLPSGFWQRIGGHYVTVAGIDLPNQVIALSDPYADNAEGGMPPFPGRIGNGILIPHPMGHPPDVHNDAGNISHDFYAIIPTSPSPGGLWGLGYPPSTLWLQNFTGVNPYPLPGVPSGEWQGGPIFTEVEFALTVSPFIWKPGGWEDYAPSCMPDFSQKQDGWQDPELHTWSFCGPVAVANSLWWFDSKFEPEPQPPVVLNDHYPLLTTYNPIGWDDHHPSNVESNLPIPSIEFVDDLAAHMGTGQIAPGTVITQLASGTVQYIADHNLDQDYIVTQVARPEWEWVVDEVSRCEDVVLLLGFWRWESGVWRRYGGHYVTVAGVDPNSGLVGLADPFFDQAENGWPALGRVWPPGSEHPPHPGMLPDLLHNDAQMLSHDVYHAAPGVSPGGRWRLVDYPAAKAVPNFEWLNGPGPDKIVPGPPPPDPELWYTEVEWAVAVSPRPEPDLALSKNVTPPGPLVPGDWLTYTLFFSNSTTPRAENVVITDPLPVELVETSFTYKTTSGRPITALDRYRWLVGYLGYGEGGTITVTARVDPSLADPSRTLTNTAEIGAATPDRYPANNRASVTTLVQTADVWVTKEGPERVAAGEPLTYVLSYGNEGPALASQVYLTDSFPTGTVYGSDNSGLPGIGIPGGWRWTIGQLEPGITISFVLTLTMVVDLPPGTLLIDRLTIGTTTPQSDESNDQDEFSTLVVMRFYLPVVMKKYSETP